MKILVPVLAALACLMADPAWAALVVTETTDFAAPHPSLPSIGVVTEGVNTISGSLNGVCTADPSDNCRFEGPDPVDGFNFELGAGLQITSFTLTGSNVIGPGNFSYAYDTHDHGGAAGFTDLNIFDFREGDGTNPNILPAPVDGSAGKFFGVSVLGNFANLPGAYSLNWTITIIAEPISPVPLPGGLVLLVTAFMGWLGLSGFTRRRAGQAA